MEVILTKEQAEAVDYYISRGRKEVALKTALEADSHFTLGADCLNTLSVHQIARAFYVGYTVEKTQEEKEESVKEHYYSFMNAGMTVNEIDRDVSCRKAIRETLDRLQIKIKGVNV